MLTLRQKQVLDFVTDFADENNYAPSLEEIKNHLGLSAVSTVHHHVKSLKDSGYLDKKEFQPRAISVYESEQMMQIPFLGMISAGKPIEPIEEKETLAFPRTRLPKTGPFYALRVTGDSMIDEKINDGDIVIIKSQPDARDGEKVVALIDGDEVTLKKIYREKGNRVRLQPANPRLKPFHVKADQLTIQGVVIDVVRKQLTANR